MKKSEEDLKNPFYQRIIENLRIILGDRHISQETLAFFADMDGPAMSKIMSYQQRLTFGRLSKIATNLGMREIDIITYPKVLKYDGKDDEPVEAVLQIRLKKDKRDQVMKLVFGDNNIEILNK